MFEIWSATANFTWNRNKIKINVSHLDYTELNWTEQSPGSLEYSALPLPNPPVHMNVPPWASQEIGLLTRLQVRITATTGWTEVLILEITPTLSLLTADCWPPHTSLLSGLSLCPRWSGWTMGTISARTRSADHEKLIQYSNWPQAIRLEPFYSFPHFYSVICILS